MNYSLYAQKYHFIALILIERVATWLKKQIHPIAVFPCSKIEKNSEATDSRPIFEFVL